MIARKTSPKNFIDLYFDQFQTRDRIVGHDGPCGRAGMTRFISGPMPTSIPALIEFTWTAAPRFAGFFFVLKRSRLQLRELGEACVQLRPHRAPPTAYDDDDDVVVKRRCCGRCSAARNHFDARSGTSFS